jgi:hypothetical protein
VPLDLAARNRLALLDLEDRFNGAEGDLEASIRALEARKAAERTRQLVILGGIIAALLAGIVLFIISLRRDVNGLSPAAAAYARLGRLAAWAGLPHEPHLTPYEYAGELARGLPAQRPAVEGIVGAYVAERYGTGEPAPADNLNQHWRSLRRPLLARFVTNLSAAANARTQRTSKTQRFSASRRRSTRRR